MDMSLDNEGITARCEASLRVLFFYQDMARIDHRLIDAIQKLRCKQAKIVFERLCLVFGLIGPVAVAQHLAQRAVLIGQFMNPIEVGIQTKA